MHPSKTKQSGGVRHLSFQFLRLQDLHARLNSSDSHTLLFQAQPWENVCREVTADDKHLIASLPRNSIRQ
jgi:hypothetical protein